jgi:hypothetical protein
MSSLFVGAQPGRLCYLSVHLIVSKWLDSVRAEGDLYHKSSKCIHDGEPTFPFIDSEGDFARWISKSNPPAGEITLNS